MPDIFDNITSSTKIDIFDRVSGGDVFDKVSQQAPDEPSFMGDVVLRTAKDIGGAFVGAGELAAHLATQAYGFPARGYGEIVNLVTGRTDIADRITEGLVYQPQSEYGMAGMETLGNIFDWWHKKSMAVGGPVQEAITPILGKTAGSVAAATVSSTMEVAPLFAGELVRSTRGIGTKPRELPKTEDGKQSVVTEEFPEGSVDILGEHTPSEIQTMREVVAETSPAKDLREGYKEMNRMEAELIKPPDVFDRVAEQPTPERGLFPGQDEFRLTSEVSPEPEKPFVPTQGEQKILPGPVEKAYRDVGLSEKLQVVKEGEIPSEAIKWQVYDIASAMDTWEVPGKGIVDSRTGEFIGRTKSTYPKWFKEEFPHDSAVTVSKAANKWLKGDALGKKETRIVDKLRELAEQAEEDGVNLAEESFKSVFSNTRGEVQAGRIITDFREFFSPLSTIPRSHEFLTSRYRDLFGGLSRVDRVVKRMRERFDNVPMSVKQDVFNAIRGELPIENLPEEAKTYAKQVRADLNRIGKMLVKRGMMTEETFLANKDNYIHYMYLRHVLPEEPSANLGSGGKLNLSYLKQRKDLTEIQRRELGLIEDVSVAAPVGIGKALGDIVKYDFYEGIVRNPDWTWQDSLIPTGELTRRGSPKFITIGKLVDEVKAYREMVQRGARDPHMIATLKNYESMLAESIEKVKTVPEDYAQVPNNSAYGPMAGAFVRKEIWNDIRPMAQVTRDAGRLVLLAQRGLEGGMTAFKIGKVAVNPPTMVRNTISNFIQWNLSGIPFQKIPQIGYEGVRSFASRDKYYRQLERLGGFQTNWSVAELGEVMKIFEKANGGSFAKIMESLHELSKYYGKIDDLSKLALYKDAVTRQGMSPADAAVYAQKWAMDYSLASRSVKYARRYALPFVTYQYKIAPLVAEAMVKRPWVLLKYAAIPTALAYWAKDSFDWSDKDLNKAQKMMAERTKDQGSYTLLPIKDERGNVKIVNLEYFFPWGNYLRAYKNVRNGEGVLKTFDDMFGVGGPYGNLITLMKTLKTGESPKDPFSGKDIYSPLDSPEDKWIKWVEWWWQVFGPSAFSSFGALGTTKRAVTGERDRWGSITSPAEAFAKWFGLNIGTLRPEQVNASRVYQIKKLEAELKKILLDPKYGPAKKKSAQIEFQKKVQSIIRGK